MTLRSATAALAIAITPLVPTSAQDKQPAIRALDRGNWHAMSKTAQSITGDIALGPDKMLINFVAFPVSAIRALSPAELKAAFDLDADPAPATAGTLYKISIPATRQFQHHNTLCGSETTEWMVTYAAGHSLEVAFFSGAKPPLFTPEAISTTTDLCGTYNYVR